MRDFQNSFDSFALALRSEDPTFLVGYCPKYYAKEVNLLIDQNFEVTVTVKNVNVDAPMNMRLLCSLKAKHPADAYPFGSSIDFQIVGNTVPSVWEHIDLSVQQSQVP